MGAQQEMSRSPLPIRNVIGQSENQLEIVLQPGRPVLLALRRVRRIATKPEAAATARIRRERRRRASRNPI
jgi:hypothetical protein